MPKKLVIWIGLLAVVAAAIVLLFQSRTGGSAMPRAARTTVRPLEEVALAARDPAAATPASELVSPSSRTALAPEHSVHSRIEGIVMRGGKPEHDAAITYKPCAADMVSDETTGHVNTNRAGKFKFETSVRSRYQVDVFKDGIAPATTTADPGTFVTIELEYVPTAGFLEGILLDSATHLPIDEFKLSVLRVRKGGWQAGPSKQIAHTGGVFRESIELPDSSNELEVVFSARGHRDKHVLRKDVPRASGVHLGEILIDAVVGLHGTVVDDRDGSAVAGAEVIPLSKGGGLEDRLVTDAQGHFVIERMRGSEIVGIAASAVNFARAYVELPPATKDGAPKPITVRLTQGAEIRGRITSSKEIALEKVFVGYWSDEGASSYPGMPHLISDTVLPNSSGEYVIEHVPAKRVLVGLRRQMGSREMPILNFEQLRWVECVPGERRRLDFQIDEECRIRALLTGKGLSSNTHVVATLFDMERKPLSMIETRGGATIEFTGIPRGRYVFRAECSPTRFTEMEISVLNPTVDLGKIEVELSRR